LSGQTAVSFARSRIGGHVKKARAHPMDRWQLEGKLGLFDRGSGDVDDFKFPHSPRCFCHHLVADLLAEKSLPQRRKHGNGTFLDIRLLRAQELIRYLHFGCQIHQGNNGAEHRPIGGDLGAIDDFRPPQFVLQLQDSPLN